VIIPHLFIFDFLMKKLTIAIDGYVGTGKGTTAQGIADIL
jgi:cytidylate kinase